MWQIKCENYIINDAEVKTINGEEWYVNVTNDQLRNAINRRTGIIHYVEMEWQCAENIFNHHFCDFHPLDYKSNGAYQPCDEPIGFAVPDYNAIPQDCIDDLDAANYRIATEPTIREIDGIETSTWNVYLNYGKE